MRKQYALLASVIAALVAMLLAPSAMISQPYYDSHDARKFFGRAIASTAPTDGQVYAWVVATSRWTPATPSSVDVTASNDFSGAGNKFNLGTLGQLSIEGPNAAVTGTTANRLVVRTAGYLIAAGTSDTSNIIGVCVTGCTTTGNARVLVIGTSYVDMDGATTAGHWAIASTTTGGKAHDSGSSVYPFGVSVVGEIKETIGSAGPALTQVDVKQAMVTPAFTTQTDGATITWAVASKLFANARVTLGANRTLNVTGLVDGGSYVLKVIQDGTGSRTLTPGTGCTWLVSNGGAGVFGLTTGTPNAVDVIAFTYEGTNCLVNIAKNFTGA